jgi:hypothetical protein
MSAPGNWILIIALLALFVACCGYAAGRIHQRRHTGQDRAAAYRDGYEKGSHSVFSLAARVIVPRRPVRAAAPVKPESDAGDETTLLPNLRPKPSREEKAARAKPKIAQVGFPVPPPPPATTVPEPPAVGGVRFQRFPDPRTGKETTVLPDLRDLKARPADADQERVPAPRRAAGHRAAEEEDTVASSAPTSPAPASASSPSSASSSAPPSASSSSDDESDAASSGRHMVPEELVKATTYRLPPDRVFRAKVPESGASSDDATTKLVPKPRQA